MKTSFNLTLKIVIKKNNFSFVDNMMTALFTCIIITIYNIIKRRQWSTMVYINIYK